MCTKHVVSALLSSLPCVCFCLLVFQHKFFHFLPYCVMVCHTPIDWQGQRRRRRWQPRWPGCHRWQRRPQGRALPLQGIRAMNTKGRAAAATRTQLGYRTVSGRCALCCRRSLLLTQVNACQRSRAVGISCPAHVEKHLVPESKLSRATVYCSLVLQAHRMALAALGKRRTPAARLPAARRRIPAARQQRVQILTALRP